MISNKIVNLPLVQLKEIKGLVTQIERYAIHDGPGIRTIVFLKGCDLRCKWCSNPETQAGYPEQLYFIEKCIKCGNCEKACPYNAIHLNKNVLSINRKLCLEYCYGKYIKFKCAESCLMSAMEMVGEPLSVGDVFTEIIKDYSLYDRSDGGVTISGGEPMKQSEFSYALLRYCKENWINTALETSASMHIKNYMSILKYLDILFVDIKVIGAEKHKKWTVYDNTRILENIKNLSSATKQNNVKLFIRIPLIPGLNDSNAEIEKIGLFVKSNCSEIEGIEILPYHRLGRGKYKALGKKYLMDDVNPPLEEEIEKLTSVLINQGHRVINF